MCVPDPGYAELHALSNFSFLRGASHPAELVHTAAALGYRALALTDECSLAGVVRAHQAAQEVGLPLIIGSELHLEEQLQVVLLATDQQGYGNLSRLITRGRRRASKGSYHLQRQDLADGLPGCLLLWLAGQHPSPTHGAWLAAHFPGRCWLALSLHLRGHDQQHLIRAQQLGKHLGLPLVAVGGVWMHQRSRRYLQDTLSAIRLGVPLAKAGLALQPSGERYLRPLPVLQRHYPRALLDETLHIAARCHFRLDTLRFAYPSELVPPGETPASQLRQLTEVGLRQRWPEGEPPAVRQQVEQELTLIAELAYEGYFLTVADIIRFAQQRGILCQGRGSAANSVVCYALGITAVNPAQMSLLFERFISRERREPPDIDLDIEHQRREEILQYLYDKYGRERAALAATVITYQARRALREVAAALGFSLEEQSRLAALTGWDRHRLPSAVQFRGAGFDPDSPPLRRLCYLVQALIGTPRHLSQHVGGMVISQHPLHQLVPIENAAMAGRTVLQWDKDDLDALALLKIDCLGLGMLSALRRGLALVAEQQGQPLALHQLPADDPAVYAMLQRGDSLGLFQVESRAQMNMLARLKPACYYDLVIQVAIVRPGPIQGKMVHPYLRRRRGQDPVVYPHPTLEPILRRTLGVPLFQEQIMQLAMVAAGFSAGEADELRRVMASRRSSLAPFRQRLLAGMAERGYDRAAAETLWEQILGFSGYGFPESHAASFAHLVYASAWLRCHYPAAYAAAMLNSQPLGFYAPAQLLQDAQAHGVVVRPVSVCHSHWDCTLEDSTLRLGLRLVKGFSETTAQQLLTARQTRPFDSLNDLGERASLDRRNLQTLAAADALADLQPRPEARWLTAGWQAPLPLAPLATENPPPLPAETPEAAMLADYQHLGLSLGTHPLGLLRHRLRGFRPIQTVRTAPRGVRRRVAGVVLNRQRPATAQGTVFSTLEDETGRLDIIIPAPLAQGQQQILLTARLLGVTGVVQRDEDAVQLRALRLSNLNPLLGSLAVRSRDFY